MCRSYKQRRPSWIGDGVGIAVCTRSSNRGDRPPEIIGVLTVEDGNRCVSTCNIQKRKQTGVFRKAVLPGNSRRLGNVVPIDLAVFRPEKSGLSLIRGTSYAVNCAEAFDLIEISRILEACQSRRPFATELRAAVKSERRYLTPAHE